MPTPDRFGLLYENITLETVDRVKIHCYLLLQRKEIAGASPAASLPEEPSAEVRERGAAPPLTLTPAKFAARRLTAIMFHGNGGNAGHRLPLARIFWLTMRCIVFMLSLVPRVSPRPAPAAPAPSR